MVAMKRAVLTAKGRVQRVGYRDEVEELARQLNLTGFVENVKPYDVRIVVEGEDEAIKQFIEKVQIRKPPIRVERVEAQFESATGEFPYFEIKRGEMAEELGERMDFASTVLFRSVTLGEESVAIDRKMLEKQDIMIEKQDVMIEKQDIMIGKQDLMLDKQDETTGEIRSLREDLKAYMDRHFTHIYREIGEIKARLGMS